MEQYLQEAMTLFDVKPLEGDNRPVCMVMMDAYIDFETRDLFLQGVYPDTKLLSDKVEAEINLHEVILNKINEESQFPSYENDIYLKEEDEFVTLILEN